MCHSKSGALTIPEYFSGQSIFITGGTGLMGKVLIEKILRSCPGVENVYVLIRPKKNVAIEERWSKITELPLFDRLKLERPDALKKIVLIPGDIQDENICPSETYRKLLEENVTMIYHVAAMVQFTDSVIDPLIQNVRSTFVLLEMAKRMKKLQVFVYVSTAYSNFNFPCADAEERVLPPCQNWKVLLKNLKTEPLTLSILKEKLMCGHPNSYTWSKSIAEQVVNEFNQFFPVIIMRPGLVSSTVEEPFPGWNDGTNACFAFSMAVALGVLHVTKAQPDQYQDLVPVDLAIKSFLIAPWKLHLAGPQKTTQVYNCATAMDIKLTYGEMESGVPKLIDKCPSKYILWEHFCYYIQNPFLHIIMFFIVQLLPAALLDTILICIKKKPIFITINKKFINGYRLSEKIMCNKVTFPNERFKELLTYLKEEDRAEFDFDVDIASIDKKDLISLQGAAFLKYYLKEDLTEEEIAKNRKRYLRIKFIHNAVTTLGGYIMCWLFLVGIALILSNLTHHEYRI